jgi:hypothetical protein
MKGIKRCVHSHFGWVAVVYAMNSEAVLETACLDVMLRPYHAP